MPDADGNATTGSHMEQVKALREQRVMLIAYMRSKIEAGDFHAVADAAMDCREIDAQLRVLSA